MFEGSDDPFFQGFKQKKAPSRNFDNKHLFY